MTLKITYISGSRADFGRAYYTLKALKLHPKFDLSIIATSMHLSEESGYTVKEIEKEFEVEKVSMLLADDSKAAMAKSFGIGLIGITQSLESINPDLVLVLGDRGEMLAAAIACKHLGIPVAHIGGGHVSGSIDDAIRDALTVFSDLHFVANLNGSNRVISLGADPSNVYIVGAPDIEAIKNLDFTDSSEIIRKYKINVDRLVLLSYHPVVDEISYSDDEIDIICKCLLELEDVQIIVTYPNTDAGGRKMIQSLKKFSENPKMGIYSHIPYKDYLGLMSIATFMIGNSSSGIIEAPSFNLPVINIGKRQEGRERATNVFDINCKSKEILDAINMILSSSKNEIKNPYGDGETSKNILRHLERYFEGLND